MGAQFDINSPVDDCVKTWKRREGHQKSTYKVNTGITLNDRLVIWGTYLGTRHGALLDAQDTFLKSVVLTEYNFGTPQPIMSELLTRIGYVSKTGKPLSASLIQKFERELGCRRTSNYRKFFYNVNYLDATKLKTQNLYRYVTKLNCQALLDPEEPIAQDNVNNIKPDLTIHEWQAIAGHGQIYVDIICGVQDKLWDKMGELANGTFYD